MSEASSYDGRRFSFRTEREAPLVPGDVVLIDTGTRERYAGQVLEHAVTDTGELLGLGAVLTCLDADGHPTRGVRRPFAEASIQAATVDLLVSMQQSAGAAIPVGTWRSGHLETPAHLKAQGFNRHTFLCGQSGSGKTYALGVILEQLILATELRMVVLDPNADFVRLGETLPGAPEEVAQRLRATDLRVLRAGTSGSDTLHARFSSMSPRSKAAVLRMDPVADRGEYNTFMRETADASRHGLTSLLDTLQRGGPDQIALAQRIENLGVLDWEVWAKERPSAVEIIDSGTRITVMDLGGFEDPAEPLAVSLEVLDSLWANRGSRTPTLIVIDEAHNVCPAEPASTLAAAVTDRLIQIAAEGRKFGLWLLLSSQRPSKLHPQVLSQCDNLALMRMNSPSDVEELAQLFGFTPPAMLHAAPSFAQGEVLLAGGFVPAPSFVQMGARLTQEGGQDVKVPVTKVP
ncbi:ATP-binding protein [Nocardioides sp.]|uniref:ATP-binding protein n=1 Tax=Nocardioides sp. TaxID=35761 RepID=UPI003D0B2010